MIRRTTLRRFRRNSSGQALAEFALLVPIFLAFVVGIIELGSAWRASHVVVEAGRQGARIGVLPTSTNDAVRQRITEALSQGGLDSTRATLVLGLHAGTGTPDTVTVRYPYEFRLLGPVVRLLSAQNTATVPGTVQLSSTFVMRNE